LFEECADQPGFVEVRFDSEGGLWRAGHRSCEEQERWQEEERPITAGC
jgi:hypothetical protein